ncbi:hypothetical protein PROFUN_15465 [Planoprotostelium fungivorum]|uniref:U6 snRNA-associated Sm-like protein LSm8 n=1 Tax=Planoprotostelium fungivorum TaxID=1890364 RepID=A0A2P6MQD3_9EUKA|nr:hypothetical protein PROFUN_16575 [Planoprotostelium fungivorum]PRP75903.1 hypothetical protein PROFUN_15465 [Planoprotostelium fungivorum]
MATLMEPFIDILTNDGRNIVGTLRGFDQLVNIILEESHERVYSSDGVERLHLGLCIIRGDNVAVVGLLDLDLDKRIDFSTLKGEPLKPVVH